MGTLVCKVELNKKTGVTITVTNADDSITQTIVMDGKLITTTVKGSDADNTSTITQAKDSIAIKCKAFSIEAETIKCHSKKETEHKSDDKVTIESTKAMALTSSDKLDAKATADASFEGANLKITADTGKIEVTASAGDIKLTSLNIKGAASVEADLTAGPSSLKLGAASAELAGVQAKVSGTAKLDLESPMTALKGTGIGQISGGILQIG